VWFVLYGPESARMIMGDLVKLAGTGAIGVIASSDGSTWYCGMSRIGEPTGPTVH
jgi:hypothetical protein